jgi:chemotaxis protein CheD
MDKSFDQEFILKEVDHHFLFPSTLVVTQNQCRIQTILGSCVSVCLFDERLKWGGINHYMLPWWNGKGVPSPQYGDIAIERLLEKLNLIGSYKNNLVAKVFGGANQHGSQIGSHNVETAYEILTAHGIKIVSKSVGGIQGRKIVFDTKTGQVFMKYLATGETRES